MVDSFGDSEDEELEEWIDTASLVPKSVGKIKGRIRYIKRLEFSFLPGEFDGEDMED